MDYFVCVDCQTKHWSIANPQQCGRCGGKTIPKPGGTDAPSMLHYIETDLEEGIEREVNEGIAAFEERLRRESEVDRYGREGENFS